MLSQIVTRIKGIHTWFLSFRKHKVPVIQNSLIYFCCQTFITTKPKIKPEKRSISGFSFLINMDEAKKSIANDTSATPRNEDCSQSNYTLCTSDHVSATVSNPWDSGEDDFMKNLRPIMSTFKASIKTNIFEKQDDESFNIPTHTSTAKSLMEKSVPKNTLRNNLCSFRAFCRSVCSYIKRACPGKDEDLFDLVENIVFSDRNSTHLTQKYSNFTTHQLHVTCFYLVE